jgi:gliding motility-associated-like protein
MKLKNYLLLFSALMLFGSVNAQLCQGSLGDPIVNITFGSGSNPGSSLSAAATTYQYVSSDCPGDGFYTVRNSTTACFSNSWYTLNSDHTGNTNGYFMLVNASYQPGAFYIDTVNVLCSNTTYEFAAWVLNILRSGSCSFNGIEPNLTFSIEKMDGTVLQTYNTGNITTSGNPTWKQYGFFFATPPDVSRVVVRITNNAPGGCGNDLALDDITFRPCGPLVDASIDGDGTTQNLCEGQAKQFNLSCGVSSGYTSPYFQWQQSVDSGSTWTDITGANTVTLQRNFLPTTPVGTYQYRLAVSKIENASIAACRVNSNVIIINVNSNPPALVSGNETVCEESDAQLSATGGTQYKWTGPNGFTATEAAVTFSNIQLWQSGTYYVEIVNEAGCKRNDSTKLVVNPKPVAAASPEAIALCEGASVNLTASGGSSYLWKPSAHLSSASIADPSASPTDSMQYMVVVSNSFSCSDSAYVQINVSKKPVANAGPDKSILIGQTTQLSASVAGSNISYSWSPALFIDDVNALQPFVNPQADAVYTLQVISNDGCGVAADSVKVHVYKGVYVPNAFSPNSDGLNDVWNIPALNVYSNYQVLVFNRWGNVVYSSKNIGHPWDGTCKGKPQPTGVYPYIIDIKEIGVKLTGWVMIVR